MTASLLYVLQVNHQATDVIKAKFIDLWDALIKEHKMVSHGCCPRKFFEDRITVALSFAEPSTCLVGLLYLTKFINQSETATIQLSLSLTFWVCIILAHKHFEDSNLDFTDYVKMIPSRLLRSTKERLQKYEYRVLDALKWQLWVSLKELGDFCEQFRI